MIFWYCPKHFIRLIEGQQSTGVGVKKPPGSSSSLKYFEWQGSNHCPLAWELGTLSYSLKA